MFSTPHEVSFITPLHSDLPASTFGECIRKASLQKGLTQKDLAAAMGINEMTIVSGLQRTSLPTRLRSKVERLSELLEGPWADPTDGLPCRTHLA